MKKTYLLLFTLSLFTTLNAQSGWEAGFMVGGSHYFGDLNTSVNLSSPGLMGGLVARYNFDQRICLKFGANYARVSADDAKSQNIYEQARNLNFHSNIKEATAQFEFNFLPYVHGSREQYFAPYVLAGFSVVNFNPQTELDGTTYDLRPLGTEGQFQGEEYYAITGAFAYGGGFKIDLSYEWSVNVELSGRYMWTDYLDDVSTTYPDQEDLQSLRGDIAPQLSDRSLLIKGVNDAKIGQPGRQRGNSQTNDSYFFLNIGMLYYFGDLKCPPMLR